MKTTLLVVLLCLFLWSLDSAAQSFSINLSPKHASKLNTIKSGHRRLVKYYKFFKKDSARYVKSEDKRYRHILDSACRSDAKQAKYFNELKRKGLPLPNDPREELDTLATALNYWYSILRDSASSDSVQQVAKTRVKNLVVEKARKSPGFQHLMDRYQLKGDSIEWESLAQQIPGVDTLSSVFNSSPEELFQTASQQAEKRLSSKANELLGEEFAQAEALKNLSQKYRDEYKKYLDRDNLKNEAKERSVKQAADYFAEHADKLNAAQARVGKLLSKYREFSNPEDLSTAVKRTSMQGKTFWEHLLVGGNFNVVSTSPVSVDFSPQLGYKFTTKLVVGVGMNYRFTFADSIKNNWYVSPSNTSLKAFASYDLIKGFFAYGEWEMSGIKKASNDKSSTEWRNNYFVGAGKKFLVHPKLYLTLTALYNLNGEDENPIYPRRFQIRMGFQLSELATRKAKVYYNPNR